MMTLEDFKVVVEVLTLIVVFSFAMSQYLINARLERLQERLVWFTGAMASHSNVMVRLEAKKQGVRTIWWNPEEYREKTGRKWPKTASHGESAEPQLIRVGVPLEVRTNPSVD